LAYTQPYPLAKMFLFSVLVSEILISCVCGFLIRREAIELSVPLTGDLENTSTHFDPTSWTLSNPIFNQTTWEAQPYVPPWSSV
jgi:hypothetical protein